MQDREKEGNDLSDGEIRGLGRQVVNGSRTFHTGLFRVLMGRPTTLLRRIYRRKMPVDTSVCLSGDENGINNAKNFQSSFALETRETLPQLTHSSS